MGRPAAFVRLSGCVTPYCPWCDTPYARETGQRLSIEKIVGQAAEYHHNLVVITGGEPFLQWHTGLEALERRLMEQGLQVQYETSGKAGIPAAVKGHVVCSPKFIAGRWQIEPESFARIDDFKFVLNGDIDIIDAFAKVHGIPADRVWIMPLGATRLEQLQQMAAAWRFCTERHYNFSPRLHILAFNDKRGV